MSRLIVVHRENGEKTGSVPKISNTSRSDVEMPTPRSIASTANLAALEQPWLAFEAANYLLGDGYRIYAETA